MPLSGRHKNLLALALISLCLGFLNYVIIQHRIPLFNFVTLNQNPFFVKNSLLRHFLNGYFSDITWCCALYWTTIVLDELNYLHFRWKVIILLLPFIVETAQYFQLINGTFDWYDMLTYLLVMILFLIFYPSLRISNHEKK